MEGLWFKVANIGSYLRNGRLRRMGFSGWSDSKTERNWLTSVDQICFLYSGPVTTSNGLGPVALENGDEKNDGPHAAMSSQSPLVAYGCWSVGSALNKSQLHVHERRLIFFCWTGRPRHLIVANRRKPSYAQAYRHPAVPTQSKSLPSKSDRETVSVDALQCNPHRALEMVRYQNRGRRPRPARSQKSDRISRFDWPEASVDRRLGSISPNRSDAIPW